MSFKDEPPQPPSPTVTAGAQTATNVSTAVANAFLNNMNQTTPLGNLNFNVTGNYDFQDPVTGAVYSIPRFTAVQQLGPTQAETLNQGELAKLNLSHLANTQSSRLNEVLGAGIDLSKVPAGPELPPTIIDPYDLSMTKPLQFSLGDAGALTRSYGPADNFSADRARVEEALYGRLNPQLALERQRTEQQLADRGIQAGQGAYTAGMDAYNRQANDLRLAVTQTAGQEQQRMMDMAQQRAQFENAAQQQAFSQLLSRGQFYNAAEMQAAQEQQQRANFVNAASRAHYFEDPATRRQQALTEAYALRAQPINEISALLSGSQVSQPTFRDVPRTNIPTTDFAGIQNQAFQQQFQNFQQQQQQNNQIIGGLFGAVGNIGRGFFMSDRDTKENIQRVGSIFVADRQKLEEPKKKKLPIYEYNYKGDDARHVGPMAQDVEKIDPGAVKSIGGIKHVNAPRLMGAILGAA